MFTNKRPTILKKSADVQTFELPRKIELLAPAKNKECGMEAIRHGADAVYIGGQLFSARAAAGNSVADIAELTAFAHFYQAKVYVALNTLLTDEELPQAYDLALKLARSGADALIVQDMGLVYRLWQYAQTLPEHCFPIPLHASTQMDNRTAEKVNFLQSCGMEQVVLARELSLNEISALHSQCPDVRLEVFIHGALCVSYSGQCYISQRLFGRSANKGCCAQACRLTYDLCDAKGETIVAKQPLLSLKDLNQSDRLEALLEAGVSSFKIEGRLKEVEYVKNLTAFYRQKLDRLIAAHPDKYAPASSGQATFNFSPNPYKSFNRGFTHYFLDLPQKVPAENRKSAALSTKNAALSALSAAPTSKGEPMGTVSAVQRNVIRIAYSSPQTLFHNGDGAVILTPGQPIGLLVNRAEGNNLYLNTKDTDNPTRKDWVGAPIFRNRDLEFDRQLARPTATRKIRLSLCLRETPFGFALDAEDEDGISTSCAFEAPKELARSPQEKRIRSTLSKLGNTPFICPEGNVEIRFTAPYFFPAARLNEWKRIVIETAQQARLLNYPTPKSAAPKQLPPYPEAVLTYRGNVLNHEAARFYRACGVQSISPAYEANPPRNAALMHTRYCIRRELGLCLRSPNREAKRWSEPLYLKRGSLRFPLRFDCARCEMYVLSPCD